MDPSNSVVRWIVNPKKMLESGVFIAALFCCSVQAQTNALAPFLLQKTADSALAQCGATVIKESGVTREDYLKIIPGIVGYFRHFQQPDGRIIDPFLRYEYQYSTPCYAWAAAALVTSGRETNLLDSAALALESAAKQLAEAKAASNHGDFFTFPAMLAYENLRDRISPEQRQRIEGYFKQMNPEECYRDLVNDRRGAVHNWNVVALCGEFLRSRNGFTGPEFVERYLPLQFSYFTADGLYRDPNDPMAYDHFPRHFLAAILERGYDGVHRTRLEELIDRGAQVSLLMQSPNGELPTGGRSAQHQWNEAQQCVSFEIYAKRNQRAGNKLAAGSFKRAAHLSLQSIQRWIRPSGELWIVKNRFDPSLRHGFQNYSSHSQYNLLTASMLASAWYFADDSIKEAACPAEVGGFAFDLPVFHKVFANANGMYVEIDTAADPEYNSTGLIRVHKTGIDSLVGPSDSSPIKEKPLAMGVGWLEKNGWHSLAEFGFGKIKSASLTVHEAKTNRVTFSVRYELATDAAATVTVVTETYELSPAEIGVQAELDGDASRIKARFPVLVFDGQRAATITVSSNMATMALGESRQEITVIADDKTVLHRSGEAVSCRNGYLEALEAEVAGKSIKYKLRPHK